jgi:hypothetical protein
MSEVLNTHETRKNFHSQLLATASAIALIGFAYRTDTARADGDNDHPLVWIELGGQLSRMDEGQEAFAPPITAGRPSIFEPSQKFEKLPLGSIDETGKVAFEPGDSGWVFSGSVRYGHSVSNKDISQRTYPQPIVIHYTVPGNLPGAITQNPLAGRFADTSTQSDEHHLITDFQAGKDVGLGLFGGKNGSSVFGFGVRFAQFSDTSNIALKSDPDFMRHYKYLNNPTLHKYNEKFVSGSSYHSHAVSFRASRSFHGFGPSISWNASAPVLGAADRGEIKLDWGVNAAVLFGRQKARVHYEVTSQYHPAAIYAQRYVKTHYAVDPPARARTVTVPNLGGFAGITVRVENFKMSAGYRADFFWGAMDGGIDTARKENVGFYGPFATVSVGIGG